MKSPITIADLPNVVSLMRELSRQTDPQAAAELYGEGLQQHGLVPYERYMSLSRRGLESPYFRITRSSEWEDQPNPWTQKEKLPLLKGGLLADLLYSDEPHIIEDLQSQLHENDPALPFLKNMNLLILLPHYDNGRAINAGVLLAEDITAIPRDMVPLILWQANLWGRATLNLVTQQKLKVAYESLDRELKVVGEIQKSLLPKNLPAIPNLDMAAHYQTSQRAGGDYYDFFPLPENQWGIFVADVSGHGTPAAVMMAITHAIAHSHPGNPCPPRDVLAYLNNKLAGLYTTNTGTFITALYAVLDPIKRTLRIASAGHPLPSLIRNGAPIETPVETGLPLGISENELYAECDIQLHPNDKLLLFTDGITEAMDAADSASELFTQSRLDAVASAHTGNAQSLLTLILQAINQFTKSSPPTDDRTLLSLIFN